MSQLADAVRAGDRTVGSWISIGHPAVAEMSAELGFDFVVIDAEHTAMSLETVESLARAVDAASGDTEPLVRVADDDPARLKRVLDTGVSGVIVPMVETADQARTIADATRYPPDGIRGVAGARASRYGLSLRKYFERANDERLVVVQIESSTGVENAADIAAVAGIDALFVGPADLSASLGRFGDTDSLDTEISAVLAAGHEADVPVGTIALESEDVERWADAGFDFQVVGIDADYLLSGATNAKERYEDAIR
ncbi:MULTISPECIES: aldolase/citrate lyase family protein [unclassified Haladaptatus]|uniref:HpcH/HpaI aldolase family protein n=1 Tax=unclassified Haladaptatus TaxID=2622732 RepID=UPI00209C5515|nr:MULTISPECIES: aldolase/citrate lyase family protein [unclassified Haladaptatus]MCO8246291.1 aldolase/citrate lyase family protein [Haladaptatus sp. AB643]MCO8255193.1 aldolase/citrate lyase family protein [Haladaptatus sp. AB618]